MGAHLNFLSPNRVVPRLCSTRRSTLIHKTSSAAMNSEVGPPQKKKRRNPSHPSFLSLPNVIVVNCLARISRSYYPKLSLVCKTFRFIILSSKLSLARSHLKTNENVLHICLQLPTHPLPSWFSLWIKPDQTLTNDIGKKKKSTGNTLLVPTPCSYYPHVPKFTVKVGAEKYGLSQKNAPSAVLRICSKETNREIRLWRKGPNMTIARERAVAGVVDGKIYVMGGCGADESMKWAEVFDPKTQTWESLPDPGAEIRHSSIKTIEVIHSKLYLRNNEKKDYVYDPRSNKWKDVEKPHVKFLVKKVWYRCGLENFLWYDAKSNVWRVVRGLATLNRNCRGSVIEMAKYRGKLLVLWDKFVHPGRRDHKYIWCAVIAVEKRNDGEVCGKIEWANIVLKVPSSYVFLRRL